MLDAILFGVVLCQGFIWYTKASDKAHKYVKYLVVSISHRYIWSNSQQIVLAALRIDDLHWIVSLTLTLCSEGADDAPAPWRTSSTSWPSISASTPRPSTTRGPRASSSSFSPSSSPSR